jgi:hypothetical protein
MVSALALRDPQIATTHLACTVDRLSGAWRTTDSFSLQDRAQKVAHSRTADLIFVCPKLRRPEVMLAVTQNNVQDVPHVTKCYAVLLRPPKPGPGEPPC